MPIKTILLVAAAGLTLAACGKPAAESAADASATTPVTDTTTTTETMVVTETVAPDADTAAKTGDAAPAAIDDCDNKIIDN